MGTSGSGGAVLGRIPPGADRAEVRSISNDQVPLSVADDGTVQWRDGELRVWGQGTPDRRDLSSLGRLSDGSRLVRVGTPNADALAVRPRHEGRRIAIRLDGGIDGSLSIATDLMPPSHLTVSRPAPDWPWTDERRAVVIGGSLALALLAAGWVVLRRRRR
jgi:hypothetical protein